MDKVFRIKSFLTSSYPKLHSGHVIAEGVFSSTRVGTSVKHLRFFNAQHTINIGSTLGKCTVHATGPLKSVVCDTFGFAGELGALI